MQAKQWVKLIFGILVIALLVWLLILGIGLIKRIFFSGVEMVNQAGNTITISSSEEAEWTPPELSNPNPMWSDQDYDQVYPVEPEDDLEHADDSDGTADDEMETEADISAEDGSEDDNMQEVPVEAPPED